MLGMTLAPEMRRDGFAPNGQVWQAARLVWCGSPPPPAGLQEVFPGRPVPARVEVADEQKGGVTQHHPAPRGARCAWAGRSVSGRRTIQALTRFADADVSRFHAEQMSRRL